MHSKQVDERTAGKRDLNQGCKTTRKTRKNTPSHNKPCELKCKSKKGNGRTTAPPLTGNIWQTNLFHNCIIMANIIATQVREGLEPRERIGDYGKC